ncbi:MAG: DUF1559 domain-containing protein [Planctomycetales bacterium]
MLHRAVRSAREAAVASEAQSPLNQIQLAFRNYHEDYGCFPPAYVVDAEGNRRHSWRALILPYIDGLELYQSYDFTESWDGPSNSRLAQRMPSVFHCPSEPPSNTHANYVVIGGPDTAFPGHQSTSLADFEDGPDHTMLLAEISNSNIPWLEPRDLDAATMSFSINDKSRGSISTSRRNGPYVVFADHIQAYALTKSLHPDELRALTTIRGHEPIFMVTVGPESRGLISPTVGSATEADLARFPSWGKVVDLWLNRSQISDASLAFLEQAPHLSKVHLAHTAITDDGLRHFRGRRYLYLLELSGTKVTDAGLVHLADLVDMYYLDLTDTQVTIRGVARLRRALPRLEVRFSAGTAGAQTLDLSGSSVVDADLEEFADSETLMYIDLSHTGISDAGLIHLRNLTHLKTLSIQGTPTTDAGLAKLQGAIPDLKIYRSGKSLPNRKVDH